MVCDRWQVRRRFHCHLLTNPVLETVAVYDAGCRGKQMDSNRSVDIVGYPHDLTGRDEHRMRSDQLDFPDEHAWEDDLYTAMIRSASMRVFF